MAKIDQSKYIVNYDDFVKYGKERHVFRFASVGKWIEHDDELCECSVCHETYNLRKECRNFCPSCGAVMKGGVDEHENDERT